ncbi:MAG: hypothetical protein ABIJ56_02835 [Pseudomonadota bacterium]
MLKTIKYKTYPFIYLFITAACFGCNWGLMSSSGDAEAGDGVDLIDGEGGVEIDNELADNPETAEMDADDDPDEDAGDVSHPDAADGDGDMDVEDEEITECEAGTTQCVGDVLVECDDDGNVVSTTPCPYGCNTDRDECNECTPDTTECHENRVVVCDADGLIESDTDCSPRICSDGACSNCVPDTTECAGVFLVECDEEGNPTFTDCDPAGCNAERLECNACPPDSTWCEDSMWLATCASDGSGSGTSDCSPYGCNDTAVPARCNACNPGTSECVGDDLVDCNADGTIGSSEACALGCNPAADPDRCYLADPSNIDAALLCAGSHDLVITSPVTIHTVDGTITGVAEGDIVFNVVAQGAGEPGIGVFSFNSIDIQAEVTVAGGNALALLACGNVTVSALVDGSARDRFRGPGGFMGGNVNQDGGGCGPGLEGLISGTYSDGGGSGGGFGGGGGDGGGVTGGAGAASGGGACSGYDDLIPLRGGSGGGGGRRASPCGGYGGGGGGAIQIAAGGTITIADAAIVDAGGDGGGPGITGSCTGGSGSGGGGGSGGGILLEGAAVIVNGTIVANGAGGGGGRCPWDGVDGGPGADGTRDSSRAAGGSGGSDGGAGGGGGADNTVDGENGSRCTDGNSNGGGGGGSAGLIRINTHNDTGLTVHASSSMVSPSQSDHACLGLCSRGSLSLF